MKEGTESAFMIFLGLIGITMALCALHSDLWGIIQILKAGKP